MTDTMTAAVPAMDLDDILDALHDIRICAPLGVPVWADDVTVTARTYSPRHIVCVGWDGHSRCLAHFHTARAFTLAELDRRGNGGRHVICDRGPRTAVTLTAEQAASLAVLRELATAITLDRYLAAGVDDDSALTADDVRTALGRARSAAAGHDDLAATVDWVDSFLAVDQPR